MLCAGPSNDVIMSLQVLRFPKWGAMAHMIYWSVLREQSGPRHTVFSLSMLCRDCRF